MRFVITSDPHQYSRKWAELREVVAEQRPRFVLVAGDLLTLEGGFAGQRKFFLVLADHLAAMREAGSTVLLFFGNDDFHPLEPKLDELAAQGLCVNLNGKVHREDGLVFCGMNKVRDYPFAYKHWCAPDGDHVTSAVQFCRQGVTVDDCGEFVPIPNLREYLLAKPSLGQELETLRSQLAPEEIQRSIWLVHNPPSGVGMDICRDGQEVGSPAVLDFIRQTQPLLGCSGHIHESPYQPGGQWAARIGSTFWFQPGQGGVRLHYVSLDLGDDYRISHVRHSIFGERPEDRTGPAMERG